jgi:predicted nucleic acid-binding protein
MVLVETSVWIGHFRPRRDDLAALLDNGEVLTHPCVIGEATCGNLKDRKSVLWMLNVLPKVFSSADEETFFLLEEKKLWGRGVGWTDFQFLASALLTHCQFWTLDRTLSVTASDLGL